MNGVSHSPLVKYKRVSSSASSVSLKGDECGGQGERGRFFEVEWACQLFSHALL